MYRKHSPLVRLVSSGAACAVVLIAGLAAAHAEPAASSSVPGRIDFAAANLPPATVEVDLSQGMIGDVFGLGEAAMAGMLETFAGATKTQDGPDATQLAAEKLAEAKQLLQLVKEVVREVRVRVYEDLPEEAANAAELAARFEEQLSNNRWENVVRVRDGDDSVHISVLRVEGSIIGVFAAVGDSNHIVLANVGCDVSPENVKQLTAAATKIGLDNGLRDVINHQLKHHLH